ncbi:hypothetical protein AVEN_113774-1 [Araneus ventricosus]|uniref:Uncharacterized protein n=1 Tax=Araneus ventricosus TaxID=182803 RepID=A0A4Y2N8B3_ARAVE|nr:hypothetical protein AVEN_113774-1 [Araneus ventricosus]
MLGFGPSSFGTTPDDERTTPELALLSKFPRHQREEVRTLYADLTCNRRNTRWIVDSGSILAPSGLEKDTTNCIRGHYWLMDWLEI